MSLFRISRPQTFLRPSFSPLLPHSIISRSRSFHTTHTLQSEPPPPSATVLPRLHSDLKTAMRSKQKTHLLVIRSLLSSITNASKTSSPITTDGALLTLLQRTIASSQSSIADFEKAGRSDLVQKEREQVGILQGYVDEIPVVGESEVEGIVRECVEEGGTEGQGNEKAVFGKVMGKVSKELKGKAEGRAVDMEMVKGIVERVLGEGKN